MAFSWVRRWSPGALLALASACGSGAHDGHASPAKGASGAGASVVFDQSDVLTAAPAESVRVGLHVSGGDNAVSLWLDGDYADASLGDGQVTTVDGKATVTLHAPSVSSAFALRARVNGGTDARLAVSVSASGFTTLNVVGSYAGARPAPSVTASVFVRSTCADLATALAKGQLADGGLAQTGMLGVPFALESVPAGSHVAVSVRIRHYAAGCADLTALSNAKSGRVDVDIFDRPLALGVARFDSTLTFAPTDDERASWQKMLDAAVADAASNFVSGDEASAWLDAARTLVPASDQGAYDDSRAQLGLDAKVRSWLAQGASLHDRAAAIMTSAKPALLGDLGAVIAPGDSDGYATLSTRSFASLDASKAGIAPAGPFAWTADAADVLHLAGALRVWPSALVCTGGDSVAPSIVSGATDVPSAIAKQVDVGALASSMLGASSIYPGCAASCAAGLLRKTLASMWGAAAASSGNAGRVLPISVSASAQANVGEYADPTSFHGAWVGQVGGASSAYGVAAFAMRGLASGSEQPNLP